MSRDNPIGTFLRSPRWMASLAAFLLIWGLLSGHIAAALLGACLFYLAWQVKRVHVEHPHAGWVAASGTQAVGPKQIRLSRLLLASVGIGTAIGGFQAYARFLDLGWPKSFAGVTALLLAGAVGFGSWILATRLTTGDRTSSRGGK